MRLREASRLVPYVYILEGVGTVSLTYGLDLLIVLRTCSLSCLTNISTKGFSPTEQKSTSTFTFPSALAINPQIFPSSFPRLLNSPSQLLLHS